MALKLKGEASFLHATDDGDEELVIAIDIATIIAVEQETGVSLLASHNGIVSMVYCASVLRHGLAKGCDRKITLGEAAEMLMLDEGAHAAVVTAFEGFLPKPKPKGDTQNPPKAEATGTGTSS